MRLTVKSVEAMHPSAERREIPDAYMPGLYLVLQPSGATLELMQPDVLVGRHSSADVRLPLPDVSRRHCRLVFGKGCWLF